MIGRITHDLNTYPLYTSAMRRISYLILPLLLTSIIASMAMPASAAYNLLQNSGFETGEFDPWDYDYHENANVWIDTPGHIGNYATYMAADLGVGELWQELDFPKCAKYLEFWCVEIKDIGYGDILVVISYSDGTYVEEFFHDTDDEWTLLHIDLDTSKKVAKIGIVLIYEGFIAVDDFFLAACTSPVGGELTQSVTYLQNPFIVIAIILITSVGVLGYKYSKR